MKRPALILALVILSAGHALAAGLNLGWDDCGGLPGSLDKTSLCDSNVGTYTLVGSYVAPANVTRCSANEIVMDMQTTGATLTPWWGFRAGLCRFGSLNESFDFTAGPFTCFDYWQGGSFGDMLFQPPVGNTARFKAIVAIPAGSPLITAIPQGLEVYSFKAVINAAKTVGLGACAGCLNGACIVLSQIRVNQPVSEPGGMIAVTAPATRAFVTWQGGIGVDCYGATPAKKATWGSIKAIYR